MWAKKRNKWMVSRAGNLLKSHVNPASNIVPLLNIPDRFNLASYMVDRHVSEGRGSKTAIVADGQRLSYAQFAAQMNQVGNALRRLGMQEGQRVLLLLPDSSEFAAAFFGAVKIGAVPVPCNTSLRSADYSYFLNETRARVLFVHSSLLPQVQSALSSHTFLRHTVVVGDRCDGYPNWEQLLSDSSPVLDTAPTGKDDVAFWLWTSGSTGPPKGAVHLQHDWIYCCENYARGILGICESDMTFSTSKLYHAYGLGNSLMFPFYVGATTVLDSVAYGKTQAGVLLGKITKARPTVFFSVPTLYASMLAEADRLNSYELSSIRVAASAAEPLPAELFRKWHSRFGSEILDGIGSTEVLHIYISARAGAVRPGSTGQPVPGYKIRVVGENDLDVPQGEVGELMVGGESIAPCYWNRPELSSERMRGGWFVSGDKYYTDQDGYFWYMGRSDDMFRVSGQWVSPIEIESVLAEHLAVLEAAVVPYEQANGLLAPKAFVVAKSEIHTDEVLARELQEFLKSRIAPYKYPRLIEFVAELPKTAAGKILRRELR